MVNCDDEVAGHGVNHKERAIDCLLHQVASMKRPLMIYESPLTGQMKMNPYMGSIYVHGQMHYVQAQPGHLPFSGESIQSAGAVIWLPHSSAHLHLPTESMATECSSPLLNQACRGITFPCKGCTTWPRAMQIKHPSTTNIAIFVSTSR